jgi:hypothetical protein
MPAERATARSHFTVDGFQEDKLGFFVAECDCGWVTPPSPDEETAADYRFKRLLGQETNIVYGTSTDYTADVVLVEEVEPDGD